jgi:hypothetical protein
MSFRPDKDAKGDWQFIGDDENLSFGEFLIRLYESVVGQEYTYTYVGDKVETITRGDGKVMTFTWLEGKLVSSSDWVG